MKVMKLMPSGSSPDGSSRWQRVMAASAALAISSLATAATAAPNPETTIWGLPRDVSAEGHRIDSLINVTNGFVGLLFTIMCIWMAYAVFKHDRKHKAEYDHGDSKHHVAVAMGISALIFFVVDGNLWFNSTIDVNTTFWNHEGVDKNPLARCDKGICDDGVVRIEINAHQWAWDVRYAGPDGRFNTADDVVTLNDVRVPKGVPVLFQIASTDVIHSFYLPNLRIKQDAMPGMITRLWFNAKDTGEFDIGCAQHCGVHHYKMKGLLTVLEPDDFKRWIEELSQQHAKGFDPQDKGALWGWDWKRPAESADTRGST